MDDPNWAVPFGPKKYLWGNVPAFDVLNLKDNEGVTYEKIYSSVLLVGH
jgi:hypothetical protein